MWKNIILIALLVTISSCGSKKVSVENSKDSEEIILGKDTATSYQSLGNGVASISLELFKNNTFKFDFKSIPQPETDEESVTISEKGYYTSEAGWKTLKFNNPKFSLAAIFDAQFGDASYFQVIDKENVRINTSREMLPIWGVVCEKQ